MARVRQLINTAIAYATKGTVAAISPRGNQQLHLVSAKLINNSGGAIDMGMFRLFGPLNSYYSVKTSVSAVIADVTAAIQAGTATSIVTTTNADGFYVGAAEIFGLVGFAISQADGGGATYTYKYWNGASFVTLNGFALPAAMSSAGTSLIVFAPPSDWVKGGTGLPANQYFIQVIASTAGAAAVQVNAAWVAQMIDYAQAIADKASFAWAVTPIELNMMWNSGDAFMPYFGTANAKNMVVSQTLAVES